ncbi:Gfo/Idh/MocA family oxidoreductase [Flavobacteriaceae bacterium]|nr:Gfo/Idh/MocA family oxidoreductase [Flavobacteriaceae bacterium]
MKAYNWAIIGCGKIAQKFSEDLGLTERGTRYAVASRNLNKAVDFAEKQGFEKAYGSYLELVSDPQVDVVYIATPHVMHMEHSILAMTHGKSVLCEKPFAMNAHQVNKMIQVARENKVFLMEAFWTRFKPKFMKSLELAHSNAYGKLEFLKSDFLFNGPYDPKNRLYNIELGGGSLLDIGIYPVFMALSYLGVPDEIAALAQFSPTGSEKSLSLIFKYKNGALASLNSSFEAWSKNETELCFEQASIRFSREESEDILEYKDKKHHTLKVDSLKGHGYYLEAEHLMKCLDDKLIESPLLPLKFSQELIETLDKIRSIIGVQYPSDKID